ncbi:MAG: hypothetical protein AAF845_01405 [Bacteroidota bacterium]
MSEPFYEATVGPPASAEDIAEYEASIDHTPLSFILLQLAAITVAPALVLSFPVRWVALWLASGHRRRTLQM